MKILVLIFTLLLTLNAAKIDKFAQEASYYRDYTSALNTAQKQNKIIMLVLVADFCPWCKKFERKILRDKAISKIIKQNFIPVIVDNYRDTKKFPTKYSTHKLPTILFIDSSSQNVLHKSTLYVKKSDFNISIHKAIKLFEEVQK